MGHTNFADATINDAHSAIMICGPIEWDLMQGDGHDGRKPELGENPDTPLQVTDLTLSFGGVQFASQRAPSGVLLKAAGNTAWSVVLDLTGTIDPAMFAGGVTATGLGGEGKRWTETIRLQGLRAPQP